MLVDQLYMPYSSLLEDNSVNQVELQEDQIQKIFLLSNHGQQRLQEGVWDSVKSWAADKLSRDWKSKGSPNKSDEIYKILKSNGVNQKVINSVFKALEIPLPAQPAPPTFNASNVTKLPGMQQALANTTAPAAAPTQQGTYGQQTGDIFAIDPDTGKPYDADKLKALYGKKPAAAATTAATVPAAPAKGKKVVPAAQPTATPAATPAPAGQPISIGGQQIKPTDPLYAKIQKQVSGGQRYKDPKTGKFAKRPQTAAAQPMPATSTAQPAVTGFSAPNVKKMPGVSQAPATSFAKAPSGYTSPAMTIKPPALPGVKSPALAMAENVNRMLEAVQTRDDVALIRKYIEDQFQQHNLVSESHQAEKQRMLREVTRVGAERRRENAAKAAK